VSGCTFIANQATGGGSISLYDGSLGGAIESFGTSTLRVDTCRFSGNEASCAAGGNVAYGAAIDFEFGSAGSISNSTFAGNLATSGDGSYPNAGAIQIEGASVSVS